MFFYYISEFPCLQEQFYCNWQILFDFWSRLNIKTVPGYPPVRLSCIPLSRVPGAPTPSITPLRSATAAPPFQSGLGFFSRSLAQEVFFTIITEERKMAEQIFAIVMVILLLNIPIFIFWRKTKDSKDHAVIIAHRIISTLENLVLITSISLALWKANHYLVLLVPCLALIIYPLWWGINAELTDEERSFFVRERGFHILSTKAKSMLVQFITFPPYYLIAAWKMRTIKASKDKESQNE